MAGRKNQSKSAKRTKPQKDAHEADATSDEAAAAAERTTAKKKSTKKAAAKKAAAKKAAAKKKTPSRKNPLPKFNYEVATITAILMSERLREIRKLGSLPSEISDPSWDNEFAGAMKRAELILQQLTTRDYDVHAYQVFPEGMKFTEDQILNEFKRVKWKDIASKEPTMKLMAELRKRFEKDLSPIPPSNPGEAAGDALDTIRNVLKEIWEDGKDVRTFFPRFQDEATGLLERLSDGLLSGGSKHELLAEGIDQRLFFNWCFPFERHGENEIRRYRPHEVFRFAAMRGWLPEKLILTLSDLASGFVPFPPKNLHMRAFTAFKESSEADNEDSEGL